MKKPISSGYYGGIFFDFILQDRLADAIIILPAFPSHNSYEKLINFWYEKGCHVFIPRFRGSYQSSGKFLSKNLVDDVIYFAKNLDKGYAKGIWDNEKKTFKLHKKIIVASGFSGAIACGAAAKSNLFSHVILASPIWDFESHNSEGNEIDLNALIEFVAKAYKNCYRFSFKNLKKALAKYKEIYPAYYLPKLYEMKFPVLVFHDPNDKKVAFKNTQSVIEKLQSVTLIEHYLGHGFSEDLFAVFWKDIEKFIKINYLKDEEREKEHAKERAEKKAERETELKLEKEAKEVKKFEKAIKKTLEENKIKVIVESEPLEKPEIKPEAKAEEKTEIKKI